MKKQTVIMDFSGIYKEEDFFQDKEYVWLDFTGLEGVNCYCTEEAEEQIKKEMEAFSYEGIHFLDSGNYHYLSKFWLEKIQKPFSLLVFDNHTDMQESAFFNLLSCGSWVREVLHTNPALQEVCIVGPPAEAFLVCAEADRERIFAVEKEKISENGEKALEQFLEGRKELSLYLSIDKDILCLEDARTNWNQGEVPLLQLERWLQEAFSQRKILGADICGENPQDTAMPPIREELERNSRTNRKLWELLEKEI